MKAKSNKYANLMSRGKIGSLELRNRLIMPAMSETLTDKHGLYTDDEMAYYAERAKGGTGLIITSFGCVDPGGLGAANQLCAYDQENIVSLKKISSGVHRWNGRIFLQLHHAGRAADPAVTGREPIGPSAIPTSLEFGGQLPMPRAMTRDEIHWMVDKFAFAAGIAKSSDFDGVEVHCAHSYLLNQFLSPMSNHRSDEYGGTTENRARIVTEIIRRIKAEQGAGFPVSVRLETEEGVPEGLHVEEAVKIARLLERAGADMINISAGGYECERLCIAPAGYIEEGYLVPNAAKIKAAVNIPVAVVGLIRSFEMADEIISSGKADFIVMGRPHIADPYMIKKLAEERENEIRPCINCLHCTDSAAVGRMECAVNPTIGYEKDFQNYLRNGNARCIAVVGGGPAGCEAARTLAVRGFDVSLYERGDRLGGQVIYAAAPPGKEKMMKLFDYYSVVLKKLGVKVYTGVEVTAEQLMELSPHAVFAATGSGPLIPKLDGMDSENVYTHEDVLSGRAELKNCTVVVAGSGGTGIETAKYLLERGCKVTLIDMLPKIGMLAGGSDTYTLADIRDRLETVANARLMGFEKGYVNLTKVDSGEALKVPADSLVLALGLRKNDSLIKQLGAAGVPVIPIGNAYGVGDISYSIKHAFYNAFYFEGPMEEMF